MYKFHIIFRQEPEGGFTAIIPSLPGCISYGDTLEEANKMIQEAMEVYLEAQAERHEKVQDDSHTFLTTINYSYA